MLKILVLRHRSTVTYVSKQIRRLPPYAVRCLMVLDMLFSMIFTPFTWWNAYRHTGKNLTIKETFQKQLQAITYFVHHLTYKNNATGFLSVDWHSQPQRQAETVNMIITKDSHNSCGSCTNCCSTYWKGDKKVNCPYLGDSGCMIYGGVIWDYSNCGRFPINPQAAKSYDCPRFIDISEKISMKLKDSQPSV